MSNRTDPIITSNNKVTQHRAIVTAPNTGLSRCLGGDQIHAASPNSCSSRPRGDRAGCSGRQEGIPLDSGQRSGQPGRGVDDRCELGVHKNDRRHGLPLGDPAVCLCQHMFRLRSQLESLGRTVRGSAAWDLRFYQVRVRKSFAGDGWADISTCHPEIRDDFRFLGPNTFRPSR